MGGTTHSAVEACQCPLLASVRSQQWASCAYKRRPVKWCNWPRKGGMYVCKLAMHSEYYRSGEEERMSTYDGRATGAGRGRPRLGSDSNAHQRTSEDTRQWGSA